MILGIDIGGTKTSVSLGDEHGVIHAAERIPTRSEEGPDRWLARVRALAARVRQDTPEPPGHIGIAAPGPMSVRHGTIIVSPNMPGWFDVPVARMLGDALRLPVRINNDANAAALAEFRFGAHRGVPDLAYLTLSTGLGAGIVSGGRLLQGASDLGGEIGHHVLDPSGPPCPCGLHGCLEWYCGGRNVARRLREQIVREGIRTRILDEAGGNPDAIDFRAFAAAVRQGDAFAIEAWSAFVEHLAHGIGTLLMHVNPSVVVLGTIAIHHADLLLDPLRAALPRYAWKPSVDACHIAPSALGARIGDLGALAVGLTPSPGEDA